MFGNNIKRKPIFGDGNHLLVQEIFKTLQGEGIFVGRPAIFLRLGGCNLSCNFCDTEFESFNELLLDDVIAKINELSGVDSDNFTHKLVVITGGEPFLQPIEKICDKLIALGYVVQIETNGTLFREINQDVNIVCSPKISNGKYHKIRPDLLVRINALKFIISYSDENYKYVADVGQMQYNIPVYVQPMDEYDEEINKANLSYALELCQKNGYILSLQTHKYLGIK